jgi:hypothetical protein
MEIVIIIVCLISFGLYGIYNKYLSYKSISSNRDRIEIEPLIPPKYEEPPSY